MAFPSGIPTPVTWTRLKTTAQAGGKEVQLTTPVTWKSGDEVVLATTGDRHSQNENEMNTIETVSDDGMTLTLKEALKYPHKVETITANGRIITMAGEIGLLTHNIKFRGSDNIQWHTKIEACEEGFDTGE